jgi:DUF1365 family protein
VVAAALYDVEVAHARRERIDYAFKHRVFLWLVDLDDLPVLPWWLRPFARFESRDHVGDASRSIRQNLDAFLAAHDIWCDKVLMLANARSLGHVFNPLTVYWCYQQETLVCVVAEVHNTYGERHRYLLFPDDAGRARVDKEFYVSPFLELGGEYLMRFGEPGPTLSVTIALRQHGTTPLTATLRGDRRPATPFALVKLLVTRPLTTHRVSALIRSHGIALWLRRIPIVARITHEERTS